MEDETNTAVLEPGDRQPWSTAGLSRSELPALNELDAALIAKRRFPLRRWFYANPIWYYHAPAIEHKLKNDSKFYELVDPQLRELCLALKDAGLKSTPSCQGHFYPESRFTAIWDELVRESVLIKSIGLIVWDSENNRPYQYRDAEYLLPWSDFGEFFEEASGHQCGGYIGISVPPERHDLLKRFTENPYEPGIAVMEQDAELTNLLGQPILSVSVEPDTPQERDDAWMSITRHVKSILA